MNPSFIVVDEGALVGDSAPENAFPKGLVILVDCLSHRLSHLEDLIHGFF